MLINQGRWRSPFRVRTAWWFLFSKSEGLGEAFYTGAIERNLVDLHVGMDLYFSTESIEEANQ